MAGGLSLPLIAQGITYALYSLVFLSQSIERETSPSGRQVRYASEI